MFLQGDKVEFISGEHQGRAGTVLRTIPMRYRKETRTYQIQIDGFPKPGGWNGKVYGTNKQLVKLNTKGKQDENISPNPKAKQNCR